jgi:hypothetical protein
MNYELFSWKILSHCSLAKVGAAKYWVSLQSWTMFHNKEASDIYTLASVVTAVKS